MASNAELHLFICLLQFMDLDYADYPGTVAKCLLVVDINTKYIQIARAIFTDRSVKSSNNYVYTNAGKI